LGSGIEESECADPVGEIDVDVWSFVGTCAELGIIYEVIVGSDVADMIVWGRVVGRGNGVTEFGHVVWTVVVVAIVSSGVIPIPVGMSCLALDVHFSGFGL